MLPFPESRTKLALKHLRELITQQPQETASMIFLAECIAFDIQTITNDPWIRENFFVTDVKGGKNWTAGFYGTTTLVSWRLSVLAVHHIFYEQTRMGRDGLFIDILLRGSGDEGKRVLRLCNTHLESMAFEPAFRPPHMAVAAEHMRAEGVWGAVLAGDLNAIQDFDEHLHADNGLRDAYLELGGIEGTEEGFTWGQQAASHLREKFGCSSMDKVLYCGGVEIDRFERFGGDVLLEDEHEAKHVVRLGFDKPWITDHLGVMVEMKLV